MNASPILPPYDDPVSFPSMPTMHGGDPNALGRIDHYDLLRKLGGGGFGVVYLAKDTNSGVEVALKTLHPLLKTNAEEMDALREKFALVSRLSHPNIATALVLHPVREVNIWDEAARKEMRLSPGDSVMVMRYAPGVTLSRWRRQFPDGIVPLDLALEIARQLASALDYAHGERIVHRDIKPGNIMVETLGPLTGFQNGQDEQDAPCAPQNGGASRPGEPPLVTRHPSLVTSKFRVRLLDFGLAAEIRSSMSRVSTEQGDTSGTRPYMAPEQWLGRKQDGRTDQYALACVLYEMLSGAPPFAGVFETGDPIIMRTAVERDAPEEIEDVPEAVNTALLRALAKSPKERFASCVEFVAALDETTKDTKYTKDDVGRSRSPSTPHNGGASRPGEPLDVVALEADVLRRKISLERALAALSDEDKKDVEFSTFCSDAELEFTTAKEAIDRNRFAAATQCIDRAEASLEHISTTKERRRRAEAERKAHEEAERIRREREEAERLAAERRRRRKVLLRRIIAVVCVAGIVFAVFAALRNLADERTVFGSMRESRRVAVVERLVLNMVDIPGENFSLGKYEVTQEEWEAVMGSNPSRFANKPKNPVENISWNNCQVFINKLNALPKAQASGLTFRLPTEDEWETACRAGARDVVRYDSGWHDLVSVVGSFQPNAWGLYDMSGNVWEWTSTAVGNGRVALGGSTSLRESSHLSAPSFSTISRRLCAGPDDRSWIRGFRLAASYRTKGGDPLPVTVGLVTFNLRWCPPGSFMMGGPDGDSNAYNDENPQIQVNLPTGFWMGETEVTQALWQEVLRDSHKSYNDKGGSYPVEQVSWNDCVQFVGKLNERTEVKAAGLRFALPTEAQWEYACRAGGTGDYGKTKDREVGCLEDMGWYDRNSGGATHSATESRTPNAWGLLNMHGNVDEWCANVYWDHPDGTLDNDAAVRASGGSRVLRGGGYWRSPRRSRSAYRSRSSPGNRLRYLGFRLVAFQNGSVHP